jgi:hypothetical protein
MQGEPKEMYLKNTEKSRICLDDGDVITFEPSLTYKVEKDFSGCYYPGDDPTIYLIGYLPEDTLNPNYKKEMKVYNTNLKKHQEILAEWERLKVLWDEKLAKEAIAKEKALLKKLKAKYE